MSAPKPSTSFLEKNLPFLYRPHQPGEQKASRTASLMAVSALGQPVWTPRNYSALSREGVMCNPVVYRCVRMIAEAASSVPLQLYEQGELQDNHPIQDLLSRPNSLQTGTDLLEDSADIRKQLPGGCPSWWQAAGTACPAS